MASFTKLSENELNYYQFKAKAMLLQKKEEKEWQDFCKQIAPDCAACLAEKMDIKESKDAAMQTQTLPKKPILRTDKTPIQPKCKSEEALINIKTRLEKIDLALSKLFDELPENKEVTQKYVLSEQKPSIQERNNMAPKPPFLSQQAKTFEDQMKLQIQKDFKTSLLNSTFVVHKKMPAVKPKHQSFFLPHDLEVKRAAARKAYLASLQTKPKVQVQTKKTGNNEKTKTSQSKKIIPARKKILPGKENQKLKEVNEETLVEAFVADDTKDENIEGVVDAIFDDLLGEVAFDLNRIRLQKRDTTFKSKKSSSPCNPTNQSSIKYDNLKELVNNNSSIMKLKMFIDSSDVMQEKNNLREGQVEIEDKRTNIPNIGNSKSVHVKNTAVGTSTFQKIQEAPKPELKFVCGVKNIVKIDPGLAKDIAFKRDRFWTYLESISRIPKGDFNPWMLNESLAESILDDCIHDVAEELTEMPSSIIQDLYIQEFVQHVET